MSKLLLNIIIKVRKEYLKPFDYMKIISINNSFLKLQLLLDIFLLSITWDRLQIIGVRLKYLKSYNMHLKYYY